MKVINLILSLTKKISFPCLSLFVILFLRFQTYDNLPDNHLFNHILPGQKAALSGVIILPLEKSTQKTSLYLKSETLMYKSKTINVAGTARITVYEKDLPFKYGDRIKIDNIRLRTPRNFKNEGAFDYESYLKNSDIYVTGSVSKTKKIELIDRNNGNLLLELIYQGRESMLAYLEINLTEENSKIIKAMVFGDKGFLSKTDSEIFIKSGTAHLMAVSGLNIGFVAIVSCWIIRKITAIFMVHFFIEKALAGWIISVSTLLSIFPVLFYTISVGWKASSVRAGIMAIVYLIAVAFSRQKEIYRSIFIAALIILLWRPLSYQDIGFQLSFMALLTIIFCYRELLSRSDINKDIPFKENKIIKSIKGNLAVNLFATLGTAPLILYHFNSVTPYAFFANIIAVPLAALIIPGSIICMLIFPCVQWMGVLGFKLISFLTSLLVVVVGFFSELPMSGLRFTTPDLWAIAGFYIVAFLLVKLKEKKLTLILTGAFILILFSLNFFTSDRDNHLKITFIDVGQGDSTLIQFPDGTTMLIDGGGVFGDFDIGEGVVAPYLWDHGIGKVDFIVPTHADNDHIEGLFYVLKDMRVGALFTNSLIPFKTRLKYLEKLATMKKVPITNQYYYLNNSNIKIEEIHPTKEFISSYFDRNENNFSTVLKLTYGATSILFASDIEKEAEEYLVRRYGEKLHSTILKVPHHGSKTSSTASFIDAVNPEVVVISAGFLNRFQHPAKEVIKRYKMKNVDIYRTDRDGAITITTDGIKYNVETYMENK